MRLLKENSGTVLLILIAAGIIWFFYGKKKDKETNGNLKPVTAQTTEHKEKVQVVSELPVPPKAVSPEKAIQAYNGMIRSGLTPIPSVSSGNAVTFKARFKATSHGCQIGDFDLLKNIEHSLKDKNFLVSIEPLVDRGPPVQTINLSLTDIGDGRELSITLPRANPKPRDYGIYLCRDTQGLKQCGKKGLMGPKQWQTAFGPKADTDRIFYFQELSMSDDSVYLIPSNRWDTRSVKTLHSSIHSVMESSKSLVAATKIVRQLMPMPGRLRSNLLELPLPYRDPNCR